MGMQAQNAQGRQDILGEDWRDYDQSGERQITHCGQNTREARVVSLACDEGDQKRTEAANSRAVHRGSAISFQALKQAIPTAVKAIRAKKSANDEAKKRSAQTLKKGGEGGSTASPSCAVAHLRRRRME